MLSASRSGGWTTRIQSGNSLAHRDRQQFQLTSTFLSAGGKMRPCYFLVVRRRLSQSERLKCKSLSCLPSRCVNTQHLLQICQVSAHSASGNMESGIWCVDKYAKGGNQPQGLDSPNPYYCSPE